MLEAKPAFAEIDLARNARIDHPLQRPVDRRTADSLIFALDQIDEIVGAEVTFLPQEYPDDPIAFAGSLGARRAQPVEVGKRMGQGPRSGVPRFPRFGRSTFRVPGLRSDPNPGRSR
jgi:hypothetical protein